MIISRRMRWAEHIASTRKMIDSFRLSVGKPKETARKTWT
jgi:hypothetical protein